jgi:hypothetical protein
MPIMEVRYPAGRLDPATKAVLAKKLTDNVIRMEGGAGTDGGRGFAWVLFTELPAGDPVPSGMSAVCARRTISEIRRSSA